MIIRQGLYIELVNRSTSRVILSAATDELAKETFDQIWKAIGDNVFNGEGGKAEQCQYYEIRVSPIR